MINVTLFDTSAATDNVGDEIIMDSVQRIVSDLLPDAYFYKVATHEYMSSHSKRFLNKSSFSIVGGTNILAPRMGGRTSLWRLLPWDVLASSNTILLGVGWKNYLEGPNAYTRWILTRMLARDAIHSVRDEYTRVKVGTLKRQVLNTACPTMWGLTENHCSQIPVSKAETVVTTLTHYLPEESDQQLLDLLRKSYKKVYFWPQQREDFDYFESLKNHGIKVLPPTLSQYDRFLENEDVDFVGTRLHGGMRALQKTKRTIILAVDNRAAEIAKDTNLPVLNRKEMSIIANVIDSRYSVNIKLPTQQIERWKRQFSSRMLPELSAHSTSVGDKVDQTRARVHRAI